MTSRNQFTGVGFQTIIGFLFELGVNIMLPPSDATRHVRPEDFVSITQVGNEEDKSAARMHELLRQHKVPTVTVGGHRMLYRYVWEEYRLKMVAKGQLKAKTNVNGQEQAA